MTGLVKRFGKNTIGRDFVVGDIHGHFTALQDAIERVGFNTECDRLFSVGDLVDRGPECEMVLEWLDKPWFHPVRGNHDDYVCRHDTCQIGNWIQNGGIWFQGLLECEKGEYAAQFRDLPIAIEVETAGGLVGIVHADCPGINWQTMVAALECLEGGDLRDLRNACMWSRRRFEHIDRTGVDGVLAVIAGHTPVSKPFALGNVIHIDTAGWCPQKGGYFTLLEVGTMKAYMMIGDECEIIDMSEMVR